MRLTQRLNFKITTRFILLFVLAFTLILLITGMLFTEKLNSELVLVAQQKLNLVSTQLNHSLDEIKSLYFSLVHDATLQAIMKDYNSHEKAVAEGSVNEDTEASSENYVLEIRERLSKIISPYASVRSAVMISNDREILDPIYGVEPYTSLLLNAGEYDDFFASQLTGRFSAANTFPINIKNPEYYEQYTVTYMAHYYDNSTYEDLGSIAINYAKLALLSDIEPVFSNGFDYAFVVNENGDLVLRSPNCPGEIPRQIINADSSDIVTHSGKSFAVFRETIADYHNWKIYGVINYQTIVSPVRKILITTAVTALIVLMLVYITGIQISDSITTPLQKLGKAMSHVGKGDWEHVPGPNTADEVGALILGYNNMVSSLEMLTVDKERNQREKKELEIAMLQSKLDLLQSQINPHFIHNTLNAMNYMAQKGGDDELAKLIVAFNGLLRTSMSTENMFSTVEDEVLNLRRYIDIQLVRYDLDLDCVYDITEEAKEVLIPKLILQPLVENSLFHGIAPNGGGKIIVRACVEDGRLWVSEFDNGNGIPKETLQDILDGTLKNSRGYSSIGLPNVTARLVLTYGAASHLVVESHEGIGTTISFSVPIEYNGGDKA